jgi:hypothetical protein
MTLKMTLVEKITALCANDPVYLSYELAERLAPKLTTEDILLLWKEIKEEQESYLRRFCQEALTLKTKREQLALVERFAAEPTPQEDKKSCE